MATVLYMHTPRLRYTDAELGAHDERSVCKSRGGSALMLGARSPGRWDPACSCGWRASSNDDKREAVRSWREHRAGTVWEQRQLAAGRPIYRVLVFRPRVPEPTEWRALGRGEQQARELAAGQTVERPSHLKATGVAQVSTDGETWTELA